MRRVAGVDEAGRGPLAGPVVAAAVVFPQQYQNTEIRDSKQLSAKKRELLIDIIKRDALDWAIVAVGHHRIRELNIREASRLAMALALKRVRADCVLVDGNVPIETNLPQRTVVHGDALCVEISAASILAKVWRDSLMKKLSLRYPGYGFDRDAGYPTRNHRARIEELGPCPIHRVTFRGVREYVGRSDKMAVF